MHGHGPSCAENHTDPLSIWHGNDVEHEDRRPEGSTTLPCQLQCLVCDTREARATTNLLHVFL